MKKSDTSAGSAVSDSWVSSRSGTSSAALGPRLAPTVSQPRMSRDRSSGERRSVACSASAVSASHPTSSTLRSDAELSGGATSLVQPEVFEANAPLAQPRYRRAASG